MYVFVMVMTVFGQTFVMDQAVEVGYSKSGCEDALYYVSTEMNNEGSNTRVTTDLLGNKQLTGTVTMDGISGEVVGGCALVTK